uniref:Inflammation and lipid regulator with UBA-like and NBR1-like domains n=1 Tax=Anas platyrhynchos platyrhynchos TaxID=8840 RepID=A0A493TPH4_ANAPP
MWESCREARLLPRGAQPCRNLQAAIGAYYDFESPNINVPSMSFVEDVTIGEGESIPPDTQFTKTWRIQNTGTEAWPPGVCLKYVGGDQFGHVNMVMVRSLEPQEIADVSVQMCSPSTAGMYQGQWRMCTATGLYYGDVIWVILSVEVGGLLGVTQQLSSFETEFNTQPHRKVEGNFNPFASPQKNRQPDENNLKDPGGSELGTISKNTWGPAPDQIEQDQNGLSQNSVNLSPSSHSNNLSVVTYSKLNSDLCYLTATCMQGKPNVPLSLQPVTGLSSLGLKVAAAPGSFSQTRTLQLAYSWSTSLDFRQNFLYWKLFGYQTVFVGFPRSLSLRTVLKHKHTKRVSARREFKELTFGGREGDPRGRQTQRGPPFSASMFWIKKKIKQKPSNLRLAVSRGKNLSMHV